LLGKNDKIILNEKTSIEEKLLGGVLEIIYIIER